MNNYKRIFKKSARENSEEDGVKKNKQTQSPFVLEKKKQKQKPKYYYHAEDNPIDNFVEAFELGKEAGGISPATLKIYREKLALWFEWCGEAGIRTIGELNAPAIRAYLTEYAEDHSQGGAHTIFRSIRAYMNWVWEEYEFEIPNPVKKVKFANRPPEPIAGIDPNDIKKLFKAAEEGQMPERDCALLAILLDTGIRKMSLYNIRKEDVNLLDGAIYIRHSKNKIPFTVYLGKRAKRYVRRYMKTIEDVRPDEIIWQTREGGVMRLDNIVNILRTLTTRAKTEAYSAHDFRRCFALQAYKNGADIYAVAEMLGHQDISVTKRYLAITEEDRKRMHAHFSPMDHDY